MDKRNRGDTHNSEKMRIERRTVRNKPPDAGFLMDSQDGKQSGMRRAVVEACFVERRCQY